MKVFASLITLFALASCSSGPTVDTCRHIYELDGFRCLDGESEEYYNVKYIDADGYWAFSNEDMETILEWAKLRCFGDVSEETAIGLERLLGLVQRLHPKQKLEPLK